MCPMTAGTQSKRGWKKQVTAAPKKLNQKLKIVDSVLTPKYIISEKYKKWHICQQYRDLPAKEWKAVCGWKYGRSVFERRTTLSENLTNEEFCTTCFDKDAADSD